MRYDKIFMTDLDGTIIYSKNYEFNADKICVDESGSYLSFMNKHLYDNLAEFNKQIPFIPITTRTLSQYERINLPIIPDYALVLNGAILLDHGRIDDDWLNKSRNMITKCQEEMDLAKRLIESVDIIYQIPKAQYVNNFFLFCKTLFAENLINLLSDNLDLDKVSIYNKRDKVYVIPKELEKGNALKRLKAKLNSSYVMAAGDSQIDESMLKLADKIIPCDILKEKGDYK